MDNKQKVIGFLFLGLMATSLVFLGLKIRDKNEMQKSVEENIQTLKHLAEEIPIHLDEYKKPAVLIYMNSECEHCQWQLKEMAKIEQSIGNTQIILISFEPIDSLNSYLDKVPFRNKDRISTYQILPEKVDLIFGSSAVPQVFIYKNNQLVNGYKGETKAELISEALGS